MRVIISKGEIKEGKEDQSGRLKDIYRMMVNSSMKDMNPEMKIKIIEKAIDELVQKHENMKT